MIKEKPTTLKVQLLKILPYIPENSENMGLSKYGMVVHDGADQGEQLTCLSKNGVTRWLSGLDEFAPEVQSIADPNVKKAAITEIRKKVIKLEAAFGANIIDIKDEQFWNKVIFVHPKNDKFWGNVFVKAKNEPTFLNPEDPNDLIVICGIEAGGFSLVAKSLEDARLSATPPKFYLDRAQDTLMSKNEVTKLKNRAISFLDKLYEEDKKKLFYVIKNVDVSNSYQYKKTTSVELMYNFIDAYVNGKGTERVIKVASKRFIDNCEKSLEDLTLGAVIADAMFYKIIQGRSDGLIYDAKSGSMIGRNAAEIAEYFKNPVNSKIYDEVHTAVVAYWNE